MAGNENVINGTQSAVWSIPNLKKYLELRDKIWKENQILSPIESEYYQELRNIFDPVDNISMLIKMVEKRDVAIQVAEDVLTQVFYYDFYQGREQGSGNEKPNLNGIKNIAIQGIKLMKAALNG